MTRTFSHALIATAALLTSASAFAVTAASSVDYGNIHGSMTVSNATFTGVSSGTFTGNEAIVAPGASLSLSFDANINFANSDYCPGCIIQEYVAWDGDAIAQGASPRQLNLYSGFILENNNLGSFTWTTAAPTTPGEYYIGGASTLQFDYVDVAGGLGTNSLASYKVTVSAVPEPESMALLAVGLLGLGASALRQRRAR